MSNNKLVFDGLAELRAALRSLPRDLRADSEGIVLDSANLAASDMAAGYSAHKVSGELADKVKVQQIQGGDAFTGAVIQNTSKLAYIFENGSQARHNALGANRGAMPPGHVFIPAVIRRRREMYDKLRAMITTHGLKVTG